MDRFPNGYVIDATYRVESVISDTDHAQVYVVRHIRFPETPPLVMKVAAHARTEDFERDTAALAVLTSPSIARVCDRGKLKDGRLYRVVERLAGPSLREALLTTTSPGGRPFSEARAMEMLVALATVVHEARACNVGPCDLSVHNLMFADGRNGKLAMMRAVVADTKEPSLDADQRALSELRAAFERGHDAALGLTATTWKPLASVAEIRAAMAQTPNGRLSPPSSSPGTQIDQWNVLRQISETLHATVYEVTGNAGQICVMKVAGPQCDHEVLNRHSRLLAQITNPHVVRVLDAGVYEDAPYVVMERLHQTLSARLKDEPPMSMRVAEAFEIIDDMIDGAEEVARKGGGPSDFSLDHAYLATPDTSRVVLTHASAPNRVFRLYGSPSEREAADVWSAVVALYELLTGRLPFPTSKHSLAKAWMGVPVPLGSRRRDVPPALSLLVTRVLTNEVRLTTRELRTQLRRLGATPPPQQLQERRSIEPAPVIDIPTKPTPERPVALRIVGAPPNIIADDRASAPSSPPPPPDWRLDVAPSRCPFSPIIAAAIGLDGRKIVAVGREAIARYSHKRWTIDPARDLEGLGGVRMLIPMMVDAAAAVATGATEKEGSWLAITRRGHVLRLGNTGGFTRWGPSLDRFCFYSAIADEDGFLLIGGSVDKRRGVIAKLIGESLTIVAADLQTRTLYAAAHLSDGSIVACGEAGHIVRIRNGAIIEATRPCEVDLLTACVSRMPGAEPEILIAGSGAWAFCVKPDPLRTRVEAVDTLSTLSCMCVDENGNAWVGSNKGRILRRRDRHWRRMNRTFAGDPAVLAIHVSATRMRAVLADGHVVIGQPA